MLFACLACHRASTVVSSPTSVRVAPGTASCERGRARLSTATGADVVLEAVDIVIVVEGPIAQATMTLTIANVAGDRAAEGLLAIELPEGAVVRGLRLEVGGAWQTARVIPRGRARAVYDAIVAKNIDPAIAEQDDPGRFSISVYPVPARNHARVELTWLQPLLEDRSPVVLPLCGLPTIGALTIALDERGAAGARPQRSTRRDVASAGPVRVALRGGRAAAIRQGRWVAARVQADPQRRSAPIDGLTILLDTSASRRLVLAKDLRVVRDIAAVLAARSPALPVALVAFDTRAVPVYDGRIDGLPAALDGLQQRGALGGTDIVGAFEGALAVPLHHRVLLVTDGIATLGELDPVAGQPLRDRLRTAHVQRLDLLVDTTTPAPLVEWLAREGAEVGGIVHRDTSTTAIVAALEHEVPVAAVELPGARVTSAPRWFDGRADTLLLAELDEGAGWNPLARGATVSSDAPAITDLVDLVAPLVGDADVRGIDRRLRWLVDDDRRRGDLMHRATRVAVHHGLLSRYTALLALESDRDFVRWGLQPSTDGPAEFHDIERMKALEAEASQLHRVAQAREAEERAYLRALETWLRALEHRHDPGPRPVRESFTTFASARPEATGQHAQLHARADVDTGMTIHGWPDPPRRGGSLGALRSAVAEAWAKDPSDPSIAFAGGRLEQASGDPIAAGRWLSSTAETLAIDDPMHGSGVYFIDPTRGDRQVFEQLVRLQDAYATERPHVLRGLEALARGEGVAAVRHFDLAAKANLVWQQEQDSLTRAPAHEYIELLAIAAASIPEADRGAIRDLLLRWEVSPMTSPGLVAVLAATDVDPASIGVLLETRNHRRTFTSRDPTTAEALGQFEGMIIHTERGRGPRSVRALVWCPSSQSETHRVAGAVYSIKHDGRGGVTVVHRPFALAADHALSLAL